MLKKIFNVIKSVRRFWNETYSEVFKKSIWPKPRELAQYTFVVCVVVVALTLVIFAFDFSLNNLINFLTDLVK
ncbi:MAG: preprotein translocase subunit SecE [Opitutales bacterium]|nr:preprotein translocase subunit SecE [Opitutales bacterium]